MSNHVNVGDNSQGIQELIDLLKNKGVSAGKDEGSKIIAEAETRAEWILKQAREEAALMLDKAKRESSFIQQAGKDALQVAFRDIKLRLKDELSNQFATQLKELVRHEMQSPDTLKQLLVSAASTVHLPDDDMTIHLPAKVMGLDELRQHPSSLKEGALMEILSEVTRELLKSDVTFKSEASAKEGLVFSLKEGEILVELTDEAMTRLLLTHLQPRFRALLEGVVA